MTMHKQLAMRLATIATALACALPAAAGAAPEIIDISLTGQPTAWLVEGVPYQVGGYGHATFGMSVDQVKAVIAADYPGAAASLKDDTDATTHRRALTFVAPQLAPGPGAATVNFVFGADGARLVAVDVSWLIEGHATPQQRAALVAAAQKVGASFAGYTWKPLTSVRGQLLPGKDNTLIVFAGRDARGGGVEIRLDGVDVDVQPASRRPARRGCDSRMSPTRSPIRSPTPAQTHPIPTPAAFPTARSENARAPPSLSPSASS